MEDTVVTILGKQLALAEDQLWTSLLADVIHYIIIHILSIITSVCANRCKQTAAH